MDVWLNGAWIPRDDARISVFDAGFQHGVGLFETMHARNGVVFRLADHLERLAGSARELGLSERLRREPLAEAVIATFDRSGLESARIRLTISGGDLNLLASGASAQHDPTILIVAQPPTRYPEELFARGVRVLVADARANPLDPTAGHKTLWYWPRLSALQTAAAKGASEALWFSVTNHLAGGCVSNAMLVKDGSIQTPIARGEEAKGSLRSPVLPGITRRAILDLAEREGIAVERRMLTIDDVLSADELFLTNSSWGVLPVVAVEQAQIGGGGGSGGGGGEPGPITLRLRAAWTDLVECARRE